MKTLEKTFRIVEFLDSAGPSELSVVAEHTELPRSTVHHHLSDLVENDLVVNDGGRYRLSLRFLDIGERLRRRSELFQIVRSEIDELAKKTDAPVTGCVLERGHAIVLYTRGQNPNIPITLHAGQHLPLHATAPGKAILSMIREDSGSDPIGALDLHAYTEKTITDGSQLDATLAVAGDRGYAIDREERWDGRCGIAVPFAPQGKSSYAAVELALPPERAREEDLQALTSELQRTASVINIKSDYSS